MHGAFAANSSSVPSMAICLVAAEWQLAGKWPNVPLARRFIWRFAKRAVCRCTPNWPFDGHLAKSQPGGSCQSPLCLQITIGWTSAGQKFLTVRERGTSSVAPSVSSLQAACGSLSPQAAVEELRSHRVEFSILRDASGLSPAPWPL